MAQVLLRVKNAEQLEAQARARAEQHAAQRHRLRVEGKLVPPPETDILGTWQVVEERFVLVGECLETELGRFVIRFEVLTPEGSLFGTFEESDFVLTSGMLAGTRWPHATTGVLDGRLLEPDRLRCRILPQEGTILEHNRGFVLIVGELMEATLGPGTMEGVLQNDQIGKLAEFRAVKLED